VPSDQRPRQGHALLLAPGKLRRPAIGIGLHLHEAKHVQGLGPTLGLAHARHGEAEGDIVDKVEMGKQCIGLEHHRRATLGRRQVVDDRGAQPDVTDRNAFVTSDHPQG
jgi:hypothetical protein